MRGIRPTMHHFPRRSEHKSAVDHGLLIQEALYGRIAVALNVADPQGPLMHGQVNTSSQTRGSCLCDSQTADEYPIEI